MKTMNTTQLAHKIEETESPINQHTAQGQAW